MDRRRFLTKTGLALGAVASGGGLAGLIDSRLAGAERQRGRIALTFDDGPGPGTFKTRQILDDNGIFGTWFFVGNVVGRSPDSVRGLVDLGHSVQNHSWSHQDLTTLADPTAEITMCNDAIRSATGVMPSCIRPPYGATNDHVDSVINGLGMTSVLWSLSWTRIATAANPTLQTVIEAEARRDRGLSSTILFHDATNDWEQMLYFLPSIVAAFKALDYDFFTYG